jgi:hypothetical protein
MSISNKERRDEVQLPRASRDFLLGILRRLFALLELIKITSIAGVPEGRKDSA